MSKKYIDADKLMQQVIKKKPEVAKARWTEGFNDAIARVRSMIHSAATADVEEVRHGYWEQNPFFKSIYYCSECGRHIEDGSNDKNPSKNFPYCHCGAKMDGGSK